MEMKCRADVANRGRKKTREGRRVNKWTVEDNLQSLL